MDIDMVASVRQHWVWRGSVLLHTLRLDNNGRPCKSELNLPNKESPAIFFRRSRC